MAKLYKDYLQSEDVLLQSFPRSGNTWTRLLIAGYLDALSSSKSDISPTHKHPSMPLAFEIIPTLEKIDFSKQQFTNLVPFKIVKSHHIQDAPHCRAIYIYRHPADSLRSYARFLEKRPLNEIKPERILEILSNSIPKWQKHCQYALESVNCRNKNEFHLSSYELLKEDTLHELQKMISFLGIEYDQNIAKQTVESNSLQNTISVNKNTALVKKQYFWNEGQVGLGNELIAEYGLTSKIEKLESIWEELNALAYE